jgi:signal transduction histidine kinase
LDDRAKFWADLERSNGSLREIEVQARSQRGTVHTLLVSAESIEINREPHLFIFALDITERKRAEVELLRALAREKELGQLRSNFVSMVSHEFRTPLGIIQSSAEILKDYLEQLKPAEREDHLLSICHKTRRMAGLMEKRCSWEASMRASWNSNPRRWTFRHSCEGSRRKSCRRLTGDVRSNCRLAKCPSRSRPTSGCCSTFSRIC